MVVLRVILEEMEKDGDILTTVSCKVFGLLGYWESGSLSGRGDGKGTKETRRICKFVL